MKVLLKNLGILLLAAGVGILAVCFLTGKTGSNLPLGVSALLIVGGGIAYILINKRLAD